jgi:hypothetical protein
MTLINENKPIRKPLLKKKPSGKFKVQPFQVEDLALLSEMDNSANWSELRDGCDEDKYRGMATRTEIKTHS